MLFRCGDFYETYSTDAIVASEILGITLTKRANGKGKTVEMAGFPHHALDTYLPKLVRAGKRVAICDQLEDPKMTKKLVKRGITELVTPGVSINDNVLNYKENNFLAAVHFGKVSDNGINNSHVLICASEVEQFLRFCIRLKIFCQHIESTHTCLLYTSGNFYSG